MKRLFDEVLRPLEDASRAFVQNMPELDPSSGFSASDFVTGIGTILGKRIFVVSGGSIRPSGRNTETAYDVERSGFGSFEARAVNHMTVAIRGLERRAPRSDLPPDAA